MIVLQEEDWAERTKTDYYMAQIAMLLHNANCEKGKAKSLQDFLLNPPEGLGKPKEKHKPHEIGQPMDEHWAKVNQKAKGMWGAFLKTDLVQESNNGNTPGT